MLIVLTLAFTFLNGYNDSAALVATMIASGALTPRRALALAAACELLGPLLLGVAVAGAIGRGIVSPEAATRGTLIAALLGAGAWGILAGRLGLPTSATHALVGGLVGAALVGTGPGAIIWRGLAAVALALGLAPLLGLLCGYTIMKTLLAVGFYLTPAINSYLRRLQIGTSALVALSHGANDAQKGMGIITAGLVAAGTLDAFVVPGWVILACAAAIALGVALGGRRTLRTLGMRIYTIRPLHGFAAQATAGLIVIAASLLGGPASTTQVATAAIFGVGAAERVSKVRWEVGQSIIIAWLVTVPFAALTAATVSLLGLALRVAA
ncbi:MAG TPA: inorganic phosphate transporter [Chloroflexota bacterium]